MVQDPIGLAYCNHEPRSRFAWQKSGLHPQFIKPILDVANIYNMIILIRASDPNYINLLTDRYITKSMYLHAKTCSWGPMMGFVCFNPSFHKKSTVDNIQKMFQIRCLIESLMHPKLHHKLKQLCPLRITEQRRDELERKKIIETVSMHNNVRIVRAIEPYDPVMGFVFGERERRISFFELTRERQGLWAVRYRDDGITPHQVFELCSQYPTPPGQDPFNYFELKYQIEQFSTWIHRKNFHPRDVLILVDPLCPYSEDDFRCATTGDYDLFAIHPLLAHYAARISLLPEVPFTAAPENPIPNWIRFPSGTKLYKILATPDADLMRRSRQRTVLFDESGSPLPPEYVDTTGMARTPSRPQTPIVEREFDIAPPPSFDSPPPSPAAPPLQGALTNRELELISELNHRVNYGKDVRDIYGRNVHALRLFHHGPDSHNPHGSKPDLPCIALLPCVMHSDLKGANCFRGVYISDEKKLADFYFWNVICAGYALTPGINLKWFKDAHPTPLLIYDPATEKQREVQLPYKKILDNHVQFEHSLNDRIQILLKESSDLWRGDLA